MINNMTNTLVLNSGSTQSVLIKNGKAKTNGVQWNANYDGDIANVDLKLNDNGRENHYKVEMTNDELENIANMLVEPRPVNKPIHNRLLEDFDENNMFNNMESPMIIELDNINPYYTQPKTHTTYNTHKTHKTHKPRSNFLTHISSPNSFDDLKIMPFNGHLNKHTSYKRKRPKTYRIIKVKKNGRSSRRSSRI